MNETGRFASLYFCAADLDKDQTKGGSDALHPVPHSCSLRGNHWRDGPRLRHCSVDAEHSVTLSVLRGWQALYKTTLRH